MAMTELLEVYLSDHQAGSTFGGDLAEKMASGNQGTPFGSFMAGIATEIDEDRTTLANIIEALDIGRHPVKEAASWVTEKLSRLRFSSGVTGDEELARLMEMETLCMGIMGKLCLWQALGELSRTDPEPALAAFDFDLLAQRAQDQLDRIEPHRRAAATRAFRTGDDG